MDIRIRTSHDNSTLLVAQRTTQTFGDDVTDVSSTQTGPADCWPRDVAPVDHLFHTVIGQGDNHAVLARVEEDNKSFYSSGESLKETSL